ncbi:MAG: hypothetical protein NTX72_02575 [Candidatus Uhrbacteria bacterium]|nr:hypothetical protein [Candidatus Uhrbacteria bacterium]
MSELTKEEIVIASGSYPHLDNAALVRRYNDVKVSNKKWMKRYVVMLALLAIHSVSLWFDAFRPFITWMKSVGWPYRSAEFVLLIVMFGTMIRILRGMHIDERIRHELKRRNINQKTPS